MGEPANASAAELAHFDGLASRWWDPAGEFRTLHEMNPVRLDLIDEIVGLRGKRCLDVGCGGGLLSEGLARRGARVLGIDMAPAALEVARLHLLESGVTGVDYRAGTAEELAAAMPGEFDAVFCLELIEHVPDPAALVAACARLCRPGGDVVFSTINRSPMAFALGIVAAEYVLGIVPRGTHRYEQLIKPSELDEWGRRSGLSLQGLHGLHYNPITRSFHRDRRPGINYLAHFRVPGP